MYIGLTMLALFSCLLDDDDHIIWTRDSATTADFKLPKHGLQGHFKRAKVKDEDEHSFARDQDEGHSAQYFGEASLSRNRDVTTTNF